MQLDMLAALVAMAVRAVKGTVPGVQATSRAALVSVFQILCDLMLRQTSSVVSSLLDVCRSPLPA